MKEIVKTNNAPSAIGPYSQAVKFDGMLITSGQLPIDPKTSKIPEGIVAQTKQSLENVKAILAAEGYTLNDVVKTLVFLDDINDFAAMNEVYGQYFTDNYPARSAVEVAKIPKGALVEIEVIAKK